MAGPGARSAAQQATQNPSGAMSRSSNRTTQGLRPPLQYQLRQYVTLICSRVATPSQNFVQSGGFDGPSQFASQTEVCPPPSPIGSSCPEVPAPVPNPFLIQIHALERKSEHYQWLIQARGETLPSQRNAFFPQPERFCPPARRPRADRSRGSHRAWDVPPSCTSPAGKEVLRPRRGPQRLWPKFRQTTAAACCSAAET
jgi:hypothetical protein